MEASESRTIAILAEKPSVAQEIARVLVDRMRRSTPDHGWR